MALQGWLAIWLMGLAGEVHGLPWFCGGSRFVLVWCATPSGVLSSRTVCHALAPIAFVRVFIPSVPWLMSIWDVALLVFGGGVFLFATDCARLRG